MEHITPENARRIDGEARAAKAGGDDPILPLTVHGPEISYFTGKLEAALRFMELPHHRVGASPPGLARATGVAQVPGLELADGRWMTDTTPILAWLDERYPDHEIIPRNPVAAFFSRLVEDYADEWLWRPAMHYRWDYAEGAAHQGRVLADEITSSVPFPHFMKRHMIRTRQRTLFTNGDGVFEGDMESRRADLSRHAFAAQSHPRNAPLLARRSPEPRRLRFLRPGVSPLLDGPAQRPHHAGDRTRSLRMGGAGLECAIEPPRRVALAGGSGRLESHPRIDWRPVPPLALRQRRGVEIRRKPARSRDPGRHVSKPPHVALPGVVSRRAAAALRIAQRDRPRHRPRAPRSARLLGTPLAGRGLAVGCRSETGKRPSSDRVTPRRASTSTPRGSTTGAPCNRRPPKNPSRPCAVASRVVPSRHQERPLRFCRARAARSAESHVRRPTRATHRAQARDLGRHPRVDHRDGRRRLSDSKST